MVHYQIAIDLQREWKEKRDQVAAIEKPPIPDVLKGHKWNKRVYGKSGSYSVYLDGNKMELSDDQADEIKKYVTAKEEYMKKVEEIENA